MDPSSRTLPRVILPRAEEVVQDVVVELMGARAALQVHPGKRGVRGGGHRRDPARRVPAC